MYFQYNVMRFNTLFISFTLDIKQCPRYMSLKNSLVETFSKNFPKLINNSSSLNSVNHKCDGVCISDINWYRCCNFNFPFSLVSVSVEKIGVLVCVISWFLHEVLTPLYIWCFLHDVVYRPINVRTLHMWVRRYILRMH